MGQARKSPRPFTPEEDEFIIRNCKHMNYRELAKALGRHPDLIGRRIREYLHLEPKIKKSKWTAEELEILKREYNRNPDIHKLLPGRTKQAIHYKAMELGLKIKNRGMFALDTEFFKRWTPESAYFLGLIAADGNVLEDPKVLTLVLQDQDKYMLEEFARQLKCERRPVRRKSGCWAFSVRSGELVDSLIELGITPRKSLTMGWIPVPDEMLRHFVRGYIDGDGTVCWYYRHRCNSVEPILEVSILGTNEFLTGMTKAINRNIGLPCMKVVKTQSKIMRMRYNGSTARKLLEWLYADTALYLTRKYEAYQSYLRLDGDLRQTA